MATYTPNYNLHQWEPEDDFQRVDFNEDFSKIDAAIQAAVDRADQQSEQLSAAIAKKCRIVAGRYFGTGRENRQDINLGFYPVAVVFEYFSGTRTSVGSNEGGSYGGLAIRGSSVSQKDPPSLQITKTGFSVTGVSNRPDMHYFYLAFE